MGDLKHILMQLLGWRTKRHIVVIESDDWGSIRMPSKEVYEQLLHDGFGVDKDLFSRYDSLERGEDLTALFEVLHSVKDKNGNPQLHGREHLNVMRWMRALQEGDEIARLCFGQRHFSLTKKASPKVKARYMDAFANASLFAEEAKIVEEACNIFDQMYGYRSKSFIAPCYIWKKELEFVLKANGINYLQGLSLQQIPVSDEPLKCKTKYHYLGQKNKHGQLYLIRNAFFEPYKGGAENGVDECLGRVALAFKCHKPTVISSHRLNYIGALDTEFRDKNLKQFKTLLSTIKENWPDVEFMSSDQLGDLINGK